MGDKTRCRDSRYATTALSTQDASRNPAAPRLLVDFVRLTRAGRKLNIWRICPDLGSIKRYRSFPTYRGFVVKVFISWSGDQSKRYAEAIRDWLPAVLQMVTPYFTPTDVEKGARWSTDIAKELDSSQIGIICVTRDNLHADWVLFEAGALSKSLDKAHVCPIIFGISNTDLSGPLKQFQTTEFERTDIQKLINVINNKLGENRLSTKTLDTVFDKWWPDLHAKVEAISKSVTEPKEPVRSERELIEEILTLTRANTRIGARPSIAAKAVQELLDVVIDIHDDQAAERSGYQDVLNILEGAKKPLAYIASRYKGSSSDMDESIERFNNLGYRLFSFQEPEEDPDIPF